jgi:hypothetical protein
MRTISTPITPQRALFIKLGQGGAWESECIKKGEVKVGYREILHSLCARADWAKVTAEYLHKGEKQREATRYANELRNFYESGSDTLWITFHGRKLWWAFVSGPVKTDPENFKYRRTTAPWSSVDINGSPLDITRLSSKLTMVTGFRGTICAIKELGYLVAKLNGKVLEEVSQATAARNGLLKALIPLICNLTWHDFELLIDLVFTSGGWRRVGVLGKTDKDVDLDLVQPVTGERVIVQVKASATMEVAEKIVTNTASLTQYQRVFLVTHTFQGAIDRKRLGHIKIIDAERLAPLVLDAGLSDWLIDKS